MVEELEDKPIIPVSLRLPFGFVIKIREVDRIDKEDLDGAYYMESRTIKLKRRLSPQRKVYILEHELRHAFDEWRHWAFDRFGVVPPS